MRYGSILGAQALQEELIQALVLTGLVIASRVVALISPAGRGEGS